MLVLLRLGLAALLLAPAATASTSVVDQAFMRGMTVSCPMYGQIWGSELMAETLAELTAIGVEWVSIHPYAAVGRDGGVRFRPSADTGYLGRAVELAKREGIALFWKPHLAYWGSFEWRGTIEFGSREAAWRRFFDGYRAFIVDQASFAERADVDLFAIGVELDATAGREREWREVIAAVRDVYSGRIVYSANWDRLDRIPFWDAVDVIGVQAYFPLASGPLPSSATIEEGWERPLASLRDLSARHDKKVLFAEIGYDTSERAAAEPWRFADRTSAEGELVQRRLIEVALKRVEKEPFIEGMFWWKWMPGSRSRRDFSMHRPEVRNLLSRAWASR